MRASPSLRVKHSDAKTKGTVRWRRILAFVFGTFSYFRVQVRSRSRSIWHHRGVVAKYNISGLKGRSGARTNIKSPAAAFGAWSDRLRHPSIFRSLEAPSCQ